MGTEALWIPLALSAAGAGLQAHNSYRTAKRQDSAAAAGIRQQAARQREADQRVNAEIGALEGSTPEGEKAQALSDYMTTLQRARSQARGGGDVAGASDRYQTDDAAAKVGIQNYGGQVADTLSRIAAPGLQRDREGRQINRMGSDVAGIARNAGGEAFLAQLRHNSINRNPWLDAGGQVLTGIAGGMASAASPDEILRQRMAAAGRAPVIRPTASFGGGA